MDELEDDDMVASVAHLCLGPNLEKLHLQRIGWMGGADSRFANILDTISCQKHQLRELSVEITTGFAPDMARAVARLISTTDLTTCTLPMVRLSKTAVVRLARSPALVTANFALAHHEMFDAADFAGQIFPAVKILQLSTPDIGETSPCNTILERTSGPLENLTLSSDKTPTNNELGELFQTLIGRADASLVIHALTLRLGDRNAALEDIGPNEVVNFLIDLPTLKPLYHLRSLRTLHITANSMRIDDEMIQQLVEHFPRLEYFYLLPQFRGEMSKVTLKSVALVARKLLALHEFGFPFGINVEDTTYPIRPVAQANMSCIVIDVSTSPIRPDQETPVAMFLSRLFWHPRLRIKASNSTTRVRDASWVSWSRCQECFEAMRAARVE